MSKVRYPPKCWFLTWDPSSRNKLTPTEIDCLIRLTIDRHPNNRDWATMYLAGAGNDSGRIRDALYSVALGDYEEAAAEARIGLAIRKDKRVLKLVRRALCRAQFGSLDVEAAGIVGHGSLVLPLMKNASGWFDQTLVDAAIASCRSGGKIKPDFSYWVGQRFYP